MRTLTILKHIPGSGLNIFGDDHGRLGVISDELLKDELFCGRPVCDKGPKVVRVPDGLGIKSLVVCEEWTIRCGFSSRAMCWVVGGMREVEE